MANFCDQRQDAMAGLLSGSTSPAEVTSSTRGHFPAEDTQMEMLIDGTGGPPTPAQPSKKHFEAQPDAMEGGEVGMTTTTEPAPFKPSIKTAVAKPEGHGNIIAQDTAPTDLSCAHHNKRVFGGKSGGTESVVEEVPVAKRARADLDDSRVKAALHPEVAAPEEPAAGMKKQLDHVANNEDRVLTGGGADGPERATRKHFPGRGNEADDVALDHPKSAKKAPKPPAPAPAPAAPCDAPVAGLSSATANRVKALATATNAPAHDGAGMTSAEINAPVKPVFAPAAPPGDDAAGKSSADVHAKAPAAAHSAAHKAMAGASAKSCLSWD